MTWLHITPIPLDHLDAASRKDAETLNSRIAQLVEDRAAYDAFVAEFRDARPDPRVDHHDIVTEAMNAEIRGRFDRYALAVVEGQLHRDLAEHLAFRRKPALLAAVDAATQALTEKREAVHASLEKQGWTPTDGAENPARFLPGMVEAHPEVHHARNQLAAMRSHVTETEARTRDHGIAAAQLDEIISDFRQKLLVTG